MVFSSTIFLFMFLPVTILGYYILRGKGRNIWLLSVSVIFFGWSQLGYLWLIIVSILINYIGALLIGKMISHKKFILSVVIISNILPLIYFKYFDYIMESIYAFTQNNLDIEARVCWGSVTNMKKLYIVIPAYNEEENIEACINDWYPNVENQVGKRFIN